VWVGSQPIRGIQKTSYMYVTVFVDQKAVNDKILNYLTPAVVYPHIVEQDSKGRKSLKVYI